jgi:site-specific DNA recombinase
MQDVQPTPLRLAVYARVSTEEQRDGQTIDSQIAELERFAVERQWQITGVYKDEGWSGGLMARPELDRLRDDASRGLFQGVLINDVDRLARDVVHLGVIKRDLERQGIQVIFRKLPGESSPTHNLMVNILGSFAEFEREMISDRTRRGRRHKVETRQQYLGGNTSYGYRYLLKSQTANGEGHLEVVPEEAAVVRQMFAWVAEQHLSGHEVVRRLDEAHIRPRKGARHWSKSSVMRILHNEMYAGTWYYNKQYACEPEKTVSRGYKRHAKSSRRSRSREEWLPCRLPAALHIISREQWLNVQKQLSNNITYSPRHEKHAYLLKSLVRCGGCGATYVGDPCHGRYFYRCAARCKRCPSISEPTLNEAVWNEVRLAILNPDIIVTQVQNHLRAEREKAHVAERDDRERDVTLRRLETEEQRVMEAYRLGVLAPAELGRELEKIKVRTNALKLPKGDQTERVSDSVIGRQIEEYCGIIAERLDSLAPEDQQRLLRLIVRSISFDGKQVRIRAALPISPITNKGSPSARSFAASTEPPVVDTGRIANTTSGQHGRNPAWEFTFELIQNVSPKPTRRPSKAKR